jgi:hypothetical protein
MSTDKTARHEFVGQLIEEGVRTGWAPLPGSSDVEVRHDGTRVLVRLKKSVVQSRHRGRGAEVR